MSGAPDKNTNAEKKKRLVIVTLLRRIYSNLPDDVKQRMEPIPPGFIPPPQLLQGDNAWLYDIVDFIIKDKNHRNAILDNPTKGPSSWSEDIARSFGEGLYTLLTGGYLGGITAETRAAISLLISQNLGLGAEATLQTIMDVIRDRSSNIIRSISRDAVPGVAEARNAAETRRQSEQAEKRGARLNQKGREEVAAQVVEVLRQTPGAADNEEVIDSTIEQKFKEHVIYAAKGTVKKDRHRKLIKEMVKAQLAAQPVEGEIAEPVEPVNESEEKASDGEPPMLDNQLLEGKEEEQKDLPPPKDPFAQAEEVSRQGWADMARRQLNYASEVAEGEQNRPAVDQDSRPELDPVESNIPEPAPKAETESKWADPDSGGGNTGAGGRPENLFTASMVSAIPGSERLESKRNIPNSVARTLVDRDVDVGVRDDNRSAGRDFDIARQNTMKFYRQLRSKIRPGTGPSRLVAKSKNRDDTFRDNNQLNRSKHDILEKISDEVTALKKTLEPELAIGAELLAGHLSETVVEADAIPPWMDQIEFASIIGSLLFAQDIGAALAGVSGAATSAGIAPAVLIGALGLATINDWFAETVIDIPPDDDPEDQREGIPGEGAPGGDPEDPRPPGGGGDGGDGPPGGGGFPGGAERLARFLMIASTMPGIVSQAIHDLTGYSLFEISGVLTSMAAHHFEVGEWLEHNWGRDWRTDMNALRDLKAYFENIRRGGAPGAIPESVKKALRWDEKKISLTPADKAAIQQAHRGDIKPIQDQDQERRVKDLRPSFKQLGTIADDETSEEAMRERLKFAAFNYVPPGHGAARDNIIARHNRAWDEHIRYTQPIDTARYQRYDTRQLLDFRAPAGISAAPAYTNPMSIGYLRQSMQRRGIPHSMLLRDIHDNTATFQPVQGLNKMNPSIPLSNTRNTTMDWFGYYQSDQVNNPPEGTTKRVVRQRGLDPGPYQQLPAGYSRDIPPYQYGTYYDNSFPRGGAPQYVQSLARGSNDAPYAPINSGLASGLDVSSLSLLPRVPLNLTEPQLTRSKAVLGSAIPFPQSVTLDKA